MCTAHAAVFDSGQTPYRSCDFGCSKYFLEANLVVVVTDCEDVRKYCAEVLLERCVKQNIPAFVLRENVVGQR